MTSLALKRNLILILFLSVLGINSVFAQADRKIENLQAFAKLYGYVRYFHPSDEAATIDWDRFAIYGSQQVEGCKTPQELQNILIALFQPIAPTVRVYLDEEEIAFNKHEITPPDLKKYKTIAWQHNGLGFGDKRSPYKSLRTNRPVIYKSATSAYGQITHTLNATSLQGKKVIMKVRARVHEGMSTGQLFARTEKADKSVTWLRDQEKVVFSSKDWAFYEMKGTVPEDALTFTFGVLLKGEGDLWVDDVSIAVVSGETNQEIYHNDFSGEKKNKLPKSVTTGLTSSFAPERTGYSYTVLQEPKQQEAWVSIKSNPGEKPVKPHFLFISHPQVGEYTVRSIGGGVKVMVPLALYGTTTQTYPATDQAAFSLLRQRIDAIPSTDIAGSNLHTRLGNLIITWNIFQHFYPYFEIAKTNWLQDLREALARAYTDQTPTDFQMNLQKFTAKLKDGHIFVNSSFNKDVYQPPFAWEWIEGKLVITHAMDSTLAVNKGDIVTHVNGITPEAYFSQIYPRISAATKGWLDYRSRTQSLYGEKGSAIHLSLLKADNTTPQVTIKRSLTIAEGYKATNNPDSIKILAPGILYVNLDQSPMAAIDKALPQLQQSKVIICDLRGYPKSNSDFLRYLLTTPDTSKQWMQVPQYIFPDQEKIIGYQKHSWLVKPKAPKLTAKVIFLTDGSAISYAESYMSFIEHYKLATIVGQPTAGTNGNINPFTLPGGYSISWTGMKVVKHDGSQHHGVGIIPNVLVEKTIKGVRENRDEFLEKALEIAGTL
ncbi:S41 family peptidase [Rufibacter ruber]|uniref:S41 family peptidase n=1 Tax=Rufibacter ruber TaxID=1783499 RepID=UPI0009EDBAF6|nr:S41 family peptidase [Rufibacter ruber]